ncbi:MAG: hypothetical protein U0521_20470 [Anaerolineae bacterium]
MLAALVYAASPLLRRFYRSLDLSPAAVTVALGATAITVVIVIVGVRLTEEAGDQADLNANPIPAVVNTNPPTSDSLARGRALYASACAAWQGAADTDELIKRLPRLRDEELYAAVTRDGWWTLPPCAGAVDESQWWDVVNYLRSLEPISISG